MKKTIGAVLGFALLSSTAFGASLPETIEGSIQLWKGDSPSCSAQVVSSNDEGSYLLTAAHCVADPAKPKEKPFQNLNIRISEFDEKLNIVSQEVYFTEIVSYRVDADLALLKVISDKRTFPTVEVASPEIANSLTVGDEVIVIGWPQTRYSKDFQISEGLFVGATRAPDFENSPRTELFNKTTAPAYYGNSGGGLYLEREGEYYLIGVTSMMDPEIKGAFMTYFVTPENIHEMLEKVPGEFAWE